MYIGSYLGLALLWLLHWLPLPILAALGNGLGSLLYFVVPSRRRIALRNLELCMPELASRERRALARAHCRWLARSVLEHGLLLYASVSRLKRLIHVEGEMSFAQDHPDQPVMWLVPHFVGLDVAGAATQIFQKRLGASIYQTQSNPVMDRAVRRGRLRFGQAVIFSRHEGLIPLARAVKRQGAAFFNLPDMDFGRRESAFVPFFGVPAATLLAPSTVARALRMKVQPVIAEILPGGQGYRVRWLPPLDGFPTQDAYADMCRINRLIEDEIRKMPAQYLWVHRRFKTRPEGEPSLYS